MVMSSAQLWNYVCNCVYQGGTIWPWRGHTGWSIIDHCMHTHAQTKNYTASMIQNTHIPKKRKRKGKWISQFLQAHTLQAVRTVTSFLVQSHILTTEWKHFQGFVFAAYLKCHFSLLSDIKANVEGFYFLSQIPKLFLIYKSWLQAESKFGLNNDSSGRDSARERVREGGERDSPHGYNMLW